MFNVGFLSSGVTRVCWNAVEKMPVRRDELMMCVSAAKSVGEIAWRRCEGIGSRGHVVGWPERRSLDTSVSVRGQKKKMVVLAVDMVGWKSCVCVCENWLLMVLVLSVKKVVQSSAVIEVVEGGGGRQRRELNVLTRLRVSGALLILLWKNYDLAVWTSAEKDERIFWFTPFSPCFPEFGPMLTKNIE